MKRIKKFLGGTLSLAGFIGFFAESTTGHQLIVTGIAIILFLAGYHLLKDAGTFESETL